MQLSPLSTHFFLDGNLFQGTIQTFLDGYRLQADLTKDGKKILSQQITINGSAATLNGYSPVTTFSSGIEPFLRQGLLPEGTYRLCVSGPDGTELDCEEYHHAVSPNQRCISLIQPKDDTKLSYRVPNFAWTSIQQTPEVEYILKITEDQSSGNDRGVHYAKPAFYSEGLPTNLFTYPPMAPLLQPGDYLWNVDLLFDGSIVCSSLPWKFSITEDSLLNQLPLNLSYVNIDETKNNASLNILGELKLSSETNTEVTYTLSAFDESGKQLSLNESSILFAKSQKYVNINLLDLGKFEHGALYTIKLTGEKKTIVFDILFLHPSLYNPK